MIKVNLLRDQTVHTQQRVTLKPKTSPLGLLMLAALVLVGGGLFGTWFFLHRQVAEFTAYRDRLAVENNRLQDLRKQIVQFEKMKLERQNRIDVIEQLKNNQTGPVYLLNHVIHSIPTDAVLWLSAVEQKGDQVRITGFTVRGENIPDFMSNLSATGFFKTVDLELYEDQQKDAAKFTLVCVSARKTSTE
ncbi:MAG: PilN domain-containing protein [Acidobacteriia bacterium]|nr:PilN domain-containing protein [Terriglobia bacterium]